MPLLPSLIVAQLRTVNGRSLEGLRREMDKRKLENECGELLMSGVGGCKVHGPYETAARPRAGIKPTETKAGNGTIHDPMIQCLQTASCKFLKLGTILGNCFLFMILK